MPLGVAVDVAGDLVHRLADADLGGVVDDRVDAAQRPAQRVGVAHVAEHELGVVGHVARAAAADAPARPGGRTRARRGPAASSDSATCDPMKPAPPVMSTRDTLSAPLRRHEWTRPCIVMHGGWPCRRCTLHHADRPRPHTSGSTNRDRANVSCQARDGQAPGRMRQSRRGAARADPSVDRDRPAAAARRTPWQASAGRSDPTRRFHGGVLDLALVTRAGAGPDPGLAAA